MSLCDTRTLSNANSESKVQAIALQVYGAVVILLAVEFVNVKVHAIHDLQVLLHHLFILVLNYRLLPCLVC